MIDLHDLSKNYGSVRAVQNLTFSVRQGEVAGLLGPNGAGKSTTLRVLTGFFPPTSGAVRIDGLDVTRHPLEIRRRMGYLCETNPLYDTLSVRETLDLFARLKEIPRHRVQSRIDDVIALCALKDVIDKDVGALSKGFRQRLGLGLAILNDPPVLILDEPTSALDPLQQQEVRDLIGSLKEKKTVLLSTHILSDAEKWCDRLFILHQGQLAAQGTLEELRAHRPTGALLVRFRAPAPELETRLRGVPGIIDVRAAKETASATPAFIVTFDQDPRDALNRLAVETGWTLMELNPHGHDLDDIFRDITRS